MFLDQLFNIIFPMVCLGCKKYVAGGTVICSDCFQKISRNQKLFCGKCRARLPDGKKICHSDFPYLLGAVGSYGDEILQNLIHALKFNYVKLAASPLGKLLIDYVTGLNLEPEKFIVLPIPLSKQRLRKRGFNQAELIAKIFAEHFELPILSGALERTKHTKPQSETKGLSERNENVSGCFIVTRPESIAGKNILLIDDVITSGATLLAAATVLKNAGARKIIALAMAKA